MKPKDIFANIQIPEDICSHPRSTTLFNHFIKHELAIDSDTHNADVSEPIDVTYFKYMQKRFDLFMLSLVGDERDKEDEDKCYDEYEVAEIKDDIQSIFTYIINNQAKG
ncbi:hypothetical protein D1872_37070 [compost metagenome]